MNERTKTRSGRIGSQMAGAKCVITYTSNAAVDAVMAGIPAITHHDGSMARAVSSHNIEHALFRPDRTEWGSRLAYCQWLPDEIASGEAIAHILGGISGR